LLAAQLLEQRFGEVSGSHVTRLPNVVPLSRERRTDVSTHLIPPAPLFGCSGRSGSCSVESPKPGRRRVPGNPIGESGEVFVGFGSECLRKPSDVLPEVPEPIKRAVGKAGILRRRTETSNGTRRTGKVGVSQLAPAHMVRHHSQRPAHVQLESAVAAPILTAGEWATAAWTGACLNEMKPVRFEEGREFPRADSKHFHRIHRLPA
jgi:hypothetical protein